MNANNAAAQLAALETKMSKLWTLATHPATPEAEATAAHERWLACCDKAAALSNQVRKARRAA